MRQPSACSRTLTKAVIRWSATVTKPSISPPTCSPTSREGRPTARPSAVVRPLSPMSWTLTSLCRPVRTPSIIDGARVGSAKMQWTCSPNTCLSP